MKRNVSSATITNCLSFSYTCIPLRNNATRRPTSKKLILQFCSKLNLILNIIFCVPTQNFSKRFPRRIIKTMNNTCESSQGSSHNVAYENVCLLTELGQNNICRLSDFLQRFACEIVSFKIQQKKNKY